VRFQVTESDLKNRVAVSERCSWSFPTAPISAIFCKIIIHQIGFHRKKTGNKISHNPLVAAIAPLRRRKKWLQKGCSAGTFVC